MARVDRDKVKDIRSFLDARGTKPWEVSYPTAQRLVRLHERCVQRKHFPHMERFMDEQLSRLIAGIQKRD